MSSSDAEWWVPVPTLQTVTVLSASATLPWLTGQRPETLPGGRSIRLEKWPRPSRSSSRRSTGRHRRRSRCPARCSPAQGRRPLLVAYGNAPTGAKLTIALRRGNGRVAVRRLIARLGAFRIRRTARCRVTVSATVAGRRLTARSPLRRVAVER